MMQRLGIFAGTFDPVHAGHIAFADQSLEQGGLDRVIFMPEQYPRKKINVSNFEKRLAELSSLLHHSPTLAVLESRLPYFSVQESLGELTELYPNTAFSFLFGSDIVSTMHRWDDIKSLISNPLIIGLRSRDDEQQTKKMITKLFKFYDMPQNVEYIATQHSHLASSQFRNT